MDRAVAKIYIILSVTALILFLLTRKAHIRIKKNKNTVFSVGFTLFKFEFTKSEHKQEQQLSASEDAVSEIQTGFRELLSLPAILLRYLKKCTLTVRKAIIPTVTSPSIYRHFLAFATISAVIAYIDSYVEKLIILDNAFISDSDEDITFDIDLGINLFDLIILTMRLMIEGIKIARLEKENVGN